MTPAQLGAVVCAGIDGGVAGVDFEELSVTVPATEWVAAATFVRDAPDVLAGYLDLLTAWETEAGFAIALQVWSVEHRHRVRLVCEVGREVAVVPSLTGVFPGVDWHERETAEMFGIDFAGHPNLVPLLLPDPVISAPLRKDFALPARSARPWPGDVEP